MRARNNYTQLIPEKIQKEFSSIESSIKPKIKGYSNDYLREVISIVSCHVRKEAEPTQLQITFIKTLVPQGDKYLKGLIETGVIQRSGQAIKGRTSFKYNFAPEYLSKYISIPLKNAKLSRRIEIAIAELKNKVKSTQNYSEQTKYLELLTISDGYNEYIKSIYTVETNQYNFIQGSATRILNGDIFHCVDRTSGRFHSNLTNMAKGLRPFLRISGEPLINIDIKNSQPFLSTILLTNPGKASTLTKNPAFAQLLKTLKVSHSKDVLKYISLVISGNIYEFLMAEFAKEGLELTRKETKVQVLRILFARNQLPKDEINKRCKLIFKDRFPNVYRIFSKIRGSENGDKFTNFKRFAILLQRIEAHLILDVILKRIYKELPGTIAVTIHDSIMTGSITNRVEAVRDIMIEELNRFVGFSPQIKVEGIV